MGSTTNPHKFPIMKRDSLTHDILLLLAPSAFEKRRLELYIHIIKLSASEYEVINED